MYRLNRQITKKLMNVNPKELLASFGNEHEKTSIA